MSAKTTLVLLALAAAVAGYWFLFERETETPEPGDASWRRVLPGLKSDAVVAVRWERPVPSGVEGPSGDPPVLRVERVAKGDEAAGKDAVWRLKEPIDAETAAGRVDGFLSTLAALDYEERLTQFDPRAVGLAPAPRLKLTLTREDGTASTLVFGSEDLAAKQVYVAPEGASEVRTIRKGKYDQVALTLPDLREKANFTLEAYEVEKVVVERPGEGTRLTLKQDGDFWFVSGAGAGAGGAGTGSGTGTGTDRGEHADEDKVMRLIQAVVGLRAIQFPAEAPADLAPFGLAPAPALVVTLEGAAAEKRVTEKVRIGKAVEGKAEVYAQVEGRTNVVTVPDEVVLATLAKLDADEWRSRRLFHVGRTLVTRLEARTPAATVRLGRAPDGSTWRFERPRERAADGAAVDRLLSELLVLEVVGKATDRPTDLANYGLGPEQALAVALETAKGARHAVRLGSRTNRPDGCYAQREGEDAVIEVVAPMLSKLASLDPMLRDRTILGGEPAGVLRVEIDVEIRGAEGGAPPGRRRQAFARDPKGDLAGATPELEPLVRDLAELRLERIVEPPADAVEYGLKEPWATVRFDRRVEVPVHGGGADEAGASTVRVDFGKRAEASEFHVRVEAPDESEKPIYGTIRKAVADKLEKSYEAPP